MLVELIREERASKRCVIVGTLKKEGELLVRKERAKIVALETNIDVLQGEIVAAKNEVYKLQQAIGDRLRKAGLKDFAEKLCHPDLHHILADFDSRTRSEIKEVLLKK